MFTESQQFKVYKILPVGFGANTFVLTADGKTAVVIDPAQPHVAKKVEELGLKAEYVLLTHGHFDHIEGCAALAKTGAKIGCSKKEVALIKSEDNMAFAFTGEKVEDFPISFTFDGGDNLFLCGMNFSVISSPGHTAGSVTFEVGKTLFSGDTLFKGGYGRYDLPTGNGMEIIKSVKKLIERYPGKKVYCGHGEDTSTDYEKLNNPIAR